MRNSSDLFSAVQFIFVIALFCVGGLFLSLHYIPGLRLELSEWILAHHDTFFALGTIALSVATVLLFSIYLVYRGRMIRIEMGRSAYTVGERALKQAVTHFWGQEIGSTSSLIDLHCSRGHIEIVARDADLEKVEELLSDFLDRKFGYDKPFYVSIKTPLKTS